jgi:hypothetical protein
LFRFCHILIFLQSAWLWSQPPLNQREDFGRDANATSTILSTDSCYYAIGSAYNDIVPNHLDLVFTKYDLNGAILTQKFYHNDSLQYNSLGSNAIIENADGNLVYIASAYPYYCYFKFNHLGDTISTNLIDEFKLNNSFNSTRTRTIIEEPSDSSLNCLFWIFDEINSVEKAIFANLDKYGNLNYDQSYESPLTGLGYDSFVPGSMTKRDNSNYLIIGTLNKYDGNVENTRRTLHFIEIDDLGSIVQTKTDFTHDLIYYPVSLVNTNDSGHLFCGHIGSSIQGITTYKKNLICKLNSDLEIDWEIIRNDSASGFTKIGMEKIVAINDSMFAGCGETFIDSLSEGYLMKFDINGNMKWESKIRKAEWTSWSSIPNQGFYNMDITEDGGFVMVGEVQDFYSSTNQQGWLVKTDSNGCLIADCQDFVNTPTLPDSFEWSLYPNPSSGYLKIDIPLAFSKVDLCITDVSGKQILKETLISSSNLIHLSDVVAGVYFVSIYKNGILRDTKKLVIE